MATPNSAFVTQTFIPSLPFHLSHTLGCGQIFGWKRWKSGFIGFIGNSPVFLKQIGDTVVTYGDKATLEKLAHFFRWDDDLEMILSAWGKDKLLTKAVKKFPGLRLIRQEPWPCLAGFILSIYSNIPKIETTRERLSQYFYAPIHFMGARLYPFPSPLQVAGLSEKTLRGFGMGFRARYLKACATRIAEDFALKSLERIPYAEARARLTQLLGVGEKVADCILLYGLGRLEAFPVDVWIQRTLQRYYFNGRRKTARYLADWGRQTFGAYAGYAQQYLYAFGRSGKGKLKTRRG